MLMNHSRGDVLAIMDCCFASNAVRHPLEREKTFELLAASHKDQMTPGPGADSFTQALITSLKELTEEVKEGFFSSRHLHEKIAKLRPDAPPAIWNLRREVDRCIRLGRLKDRSHLLKMSTPTPPQAYLSLQFHLGQKQLTRHQIESLTRELPKSFKTSGVQLQNVLWLGIRPQYKRWHDVVEAYQTWIRSTSSSDRKRPSPSGAEFERPESRESDLEERGTPASKRPRGESFQEICVRSE